MAGNILHLVKKSRFSSRALRADAQQQSLFGTQPFASCLVPIFHFFYLKNPFYSTLAARTERSGSTVRGAYLKQQAAEKEDDKEEKMWSLRELGWVSEGNGDGTRREECFRLKTWIGQMNNIRRVQLGYVELMHIKHCLHKKIKWPVGHREGLVAHYSLRSGIQYRNMYQSWSLASDVLNLGFKPPGKKESSKILKRDSDPFGNWDRKRL